jgi:hypothetical protein
MHLAWLDPAGGVLDERKKTAARNNGEGGGKERAPGGRGSEKARNGVDTGLG